MFDVKTLTIISTISQRASWCNKRIIGNYCQPSRALCPIDSTQPFFLMGKLLLLTFREQQNKKSRQVLRSKLLRQLMFKQAIRFVPEIVHIMASKRRDVEQDFFFFKDPYKSLRFETFWLVYLSVSTSGMNCKFVGSFPMKSYFYRKMLTDLYI